MLFIIALINCDILVNFTTGLPYSEILVNLAIFSFIR